MRSLLLAGVLILIAVPPAAAQRKVDERVPAQRNGHVRIHIDAGVLRVSGWDRDSVHVRGAVFESPAEPFLLHADAAGVKLGVWNPVAAAAAKPSQLEVFVPAGAQVRIKTAAAVVTVVGVTGSVDVGGGAGSVDVAGSPREITIETMGGQVQADVQTRLLRVRTATGPVTLRGSIADATVVTVDGSVDIFATDLDRGRFESVEGDIRLHAPLRRGASLDFINHAGAVEIALSARTHAEITVSTFESTVENALGVKPSARAARGKGRDETYLLGNGGSWISIRSFRGPIRLNRS